MKTIITEDSLDKIWDSSNKRVLELRELRNKYPVLVNQIDQLKREYIICLNSISIRDYKKDYKPDGSWVVKIKKWIWC